MTVAALYIDPLGPYPKMAGVECWDASRDARLYDGPHPVVAHPPCGPWGRLRHKYRGAEHDCAPRAVEQVRRWGGVLEHPAGSRLWESCGLPLAPRIWNWDLFRASSPNFGAPVDSFGGYALEVDQCEWAHVARKGTWLYLVGVPREALEAPPFPGREPTHWCSGFRRKGAEPGTSGYKATGCAVPPGIKVCSAQQRRRTPPLFAEYLVRLARNVSK